LKYDINSVIAQYRKNKNLKYIFFWGHNPKVPEFVDKACLSQWYSCRFTVDNTEYHTAEQYMMAQKAVLFNDMVVYDRIMNSDNPAEYKKLGRLIHNFDEEIWNSRKCEIVIKGNVAKFSQNPELTEFILKTGNRILVEASPYDRIWGIGLSQNNGDVFNPLKWNGTNLLGFCLMEARDIIINRNAC